MGQKVSLLSLQFLHVGLSHVAQIICDCRHLVAALGNQGEGDEGAEDAHFYLVTSFFLFLKCTVYCHSLQHNFRYTAK